jgi:ubiquinone biosynthesis protein COQ9
VDYRHFRDGWQYASLTLLSRLGYPPSDREIASFLANDADALALAGLRGSYETTASILQLRLAQLGSDSPRAMA